MKQERYAKLIQYKVALDSEWKRRNPVGIYNDEYEKTLSQAKLDKFKVMRNSNGEHKLKDALPEGKMDYSDLFGSIFGSYMYR